MHSNERNGEPALATANTIAEGDKLFRSRQFAAALEVYQRAAEMSETPSGDLCAKLARALLEAKRPTEACEWALRVVDFGSSFANWSAAAKVIQRCDSSEVPRIRRRLRLALVGTWTTNALTPLVILAAARSGIGLDVYESSFDQYFTETLDAQSTLFRSKPEVLLLCPDHHSLGIPLHSVSSEEILDIELERWVKIWRAVRAVGPVTIVQQNFALPAMGRFGHYGSGLIGSRQFIASELNHRLAISAQNEDVGFVNLEGLASQMGKDLWFDERNWYLAKMPFSPAALPIIARHTAAVLAARLGLSRRCLVLDLDNTLWGGVIGDDGLEGLVLGDGPDGEAYLDFQRAIKDLSQRGIILAVCSKNDPQIAREPFVSHPEMILKLDDIAVFIANWNSKSENMVEIARTLDLGLDALTFADDNPYERAEVQKALPQVDIVPLPSEPTGFRRALDNYPYFEPSSFTTEDANRSRQYQARSKAADLKSENASLHEYQASLNMIATIGPIDGPNLPRVVQLINKTNQFNLTTRRRDRQEVEKLMTGPGVEHFWVRLKDRFADHGLIAVVIVRTVEAALEIDTLLMSCRVIGRKVEQVILDELIRRAKANDCTQVTGTYIPSSRNSIVSDLYSKLGFTLYETCADGTTRWALDPNQRFESTTTIKVVNKRHGSDFQELKIA